LSPSAAGITLCINAKPSQSQPHVGTYPIEHTDLREIYGRRAADWAVSRFLGHELEAQDRLATSGAMALGDRGENIIA
jgi:hypothetical protein